MKQFISFSGGVESSTMCILYGNKADGIFADTNFEHKPIYERIAKVEKAVRNFHNNDFKIHIVKRDGESLPEYIESSKFYPSFQSRFCTRMFKIEPIDNFLKQYKKDGATLLIGLNADEIGDGVNDPRTGNHGNLPFIKYSYPLADNGITRKMCIQILESVDLAPKFPPYMQRGGCIGCYYKSKKEFEALAILAADEFDQVAELEAIIQDKRDKFYHIVDSIPNLKDFKRHAQSILFNPDEIYPVINNASKCGVFCNR